MVSIAHRTTDRINCFDLARSLAKAGMILVRWKYFSEYSRADRTLVRAKLSIRLRNSLSTPFGILDGPLPLPFT